MASVGVGAPDGELGGQQESGKGSIRVAGSEFSAAAAHDHADEQRSVAPPRNHGPRKSCDRPFIRAAGFLVTVMGADHQQGPTNLVGLLDDDPASRRRCLNTPPYGGPPPRSLQ